MKCPKCNGTGRIPDPERLRKVRLKKGLSLRAMAESIGVSAAYLSDVELGRRAATRKIINGYGLK